MCIWPPGWKQHSEQPCYKISAQNCGEFSPDIAFLALWNIFWYYEILFVFGISEYQVSFHLPVQPDLTHICCYESFVVFQIVSLTEVLRSIRWNFDRGSDVIIFRWCDNVIPTVNTGRAPLWAPHAPIMAFIYYTNHSLGAIFQSKHKYIKYKYKYRLHSRYNVHLSRGTTFQSKQNGRKHSDSQSLPWFWVACVEEGGEWVGRTKIGARSNKKVHCSFPDHLALDPTCRWGGEC